MKQFVLCILLFSIALNCQATSKNQSLSEIRHQVDLFMRNQVPVDQGDHLSIEVGQIDNRLQLKACPEGQLQVFNPYPGAMSQTNTVGVKCNSENKRWTLYLSVKMHIEKKILVAKRNLGRGHIITDDDLIFARQDVVHLKYGWFTNKKDIVGKLCKQNININHPITPYLLDKETLVRRGELVTIKADKDNIHISMQGKALSKGRQGDVIRVENSRTNRIIQAEVIGSRTVRVII